MLNKNIKAARYIELQAQIKALDDELKALKDEFISELEKTKGTIDNREHIIYTLDSSKYSIILDCTPTTKIDTAAVKKAYPGEFLKTSLSRTLKIS